MVRWILTILLSVLLSESSFSQLIVFKSASYSYELNNTSTDSINVGNGIFINGNIGQVTVVIPFDPIERIMNVSFADFIDDDSKSFLFQGLLDGEYDLTTEGIYDVVGKESILIKMKTPLSLSDYGFEISEPENSELIKNLTISINSNTRLEN